ncbi:hypothetical protein [Klebsiella pneumoniae]|uniref:hypothetical protein n=1 Tax=Klebsiella pneumoniae TaxID=573 RepID=UPI000F2CD269|nr:hypothetical protein [Klebsiella pneumoniae]VCX11394.1 hypothetical protein BANRA_05680 [Klebsiella pneumoniae]
MFNTDSLAEVAHSGAGPADLSVGQLAVPGYYGLAGAFLVIGLFSVWLNFGPDGCVLGLSRKATGYADRYKRDNKRPAPFSVLASLVRPGGWSGHVDMSGTTRTG